MRFIVWVGKYLIYPTIYMRQLETVDQLVSYLSGFQEGASKKDNAGREGKLINSINEG
jgi:hypothetical protein